MVFDEAIKIVKHVCESPLALYVFSNDEDNINKVLDNTASGGVCINDTLSHVANSNLPFGGIGASVVSLLIGIVILTFLPSPSD